MGLKLENLVYDIETHPVIVAIIAFLLFFVISRFASKKPTTATSTTGGGDTKPAGVQETYNQTFNQYPTTVPPTQTQIPPPPPIPNPPVTVTHLLIRQASTADLQKKIKSIPIKSSATRGSTSGSLAFGAKVDATGPAVIGDYNYPLSGGSGSNMWYPVHGGFVSAYDVASVTVS